MGKFNQKEYNKQWDKQNMKTINTRYKAEFVDEFKEACKTLGIVQSQAIKQAMAEVIEKAKKERK